MMNRKFFVAIILGISLICSLIGYLSNSDQCKHSALTMANIEALSDDEGDICEGRVCTNCDRWANCYKPNGDWIMSICTATSTYTQTSCMQVCNHYHVSRCGAGQIERD